MDVLLIEDDIFQAMVIGTVLEANEGTRVAIAHSGAEALMQVDHLDYHPDLVVCDLCMPEMDGIELLYRLSKSLPDTSYAILSAANDDVIESALRTANGYGINNMAAYSKPLSALEAQDMISSLNNKQQHSSPSCQPLVFNRDTLFNAISEGQFEVFYQPQVSCQSNAIWGAEALIRWNHPTLGVLTPFQFLDLVEEYELMSALTKFVIEQALADAAHFQSTMPGCNVSINVTANDVSQRSFASDLIKLTQAFNLSPNSITIEVTESGFTKDATTMLETLTRLRLAGFGVSIDDFGTGYSSLHQLMTAPFNELKVDRSFVQQIMTSDKHQKSVKAICSLCKELEIKTVVEGVETPEQLAQLRHLGADIIQGYYFGKPMGKGDFLDWSKTYRSFSYELTKLTA